MTPDEVRRRIAAEWPDWRVHRVDLFSDAGWDYQLFLADGRWVVRVGRTAPARAHLRWEARTPDRLGDAGGILVPRYVRRSRWAGVYPLIPGAPRPEGDGEIGRDALEAAAWRIGAFLSGLHALWPVDPAREARAQRRWAARFRRLSRRLAEEVWPRLSPSAAQSAAARLGRFVEGLEKDPPPMRLIHADLSFDHLLWEQDRISGVIDFGDMTVGDPMLDFAGLGPLCAGARDSYRGRVELHRVAVYRWLAPVYGALHALATHDAGQLQRALDAVAKEGRQDP